MTKPTGKPRGRPTNARRDAEAAARQDGWVNILTNLGGRGDPNAHTKYTLHQHIDRKTLSSIYRSDGMGKRIVNLVPEEAIREWIEADESLLEELTRIDAKQSILSACRWARLFGGAVIFALIDDGQDAEEPIRPAGIRRIVGLRVYDRHRVTWTVGDIENDPTSSQFGKPKIYTIQPVNGTPFKSHYSRLKVMDGDDLTDEDRQLNQGWGDSVLQAAYQSLQNRGITMNASAGIIRDFVQTILSIKGLTDMLRQGSDDLVSKRINLIDMTRSVNNAIYLDADGEQYSKQSSSVAGLPDLLDRFIEDISAATGIPVSKLIGRAVGGLSSTGEGDRKAWYDTVRSYQSDEVQPAIKWIVDLLLLQIEWRNKPTNTGWSFPSLDQPTEAQWADVKLKTAQADAVYINAGAVDPEFLWELRNKGGQFKTEIAYKPEDYDEWLSQRPAPPPIPEPEPSEPEPEPINVQQVAEDAAERVITKRLQQRDDDISRAILDALRDA